MWSTVIIYTIFTKEMAVQLDFDEINSGCDYCNTDFPVSSWSCELRFSSNRHVSEWKIPNHWSYIFSPLQHALPNPISFFLIRWSPVQFIITLSVLIRFNVITKNSTSAFLRMCSYSRVDVHHKSATKSTTCIFLTNVLFSTYRCLVPQ